MHPGAVVLTAKPAACHDECLHKVHAQLGEGQGLRQEEAHWGTERNREAAVEDWSSKVSHGRHLALQPVCVLAFLDPPLHQLGRAQAAGADGDPLAAIRHLQSELHWLLKVQRAMMQHYVAAPEATIQKGLRMVQTMILNEI